MCTSKVETKLLALLTTPSNEGTVDNSTAEFNVIPVFSHEADGELRELSKLPGSTYLEANGVQHGRRRVWPYIVDKIGGRACLESGGG